jgi:trans-aconitate 2-methyltransferase
MRDWDAATYHRVSSPHVEWATVLLDRLHLNGDETVLDAGCGSGRVTLMLLERLPHGHVVAVDQAPSMVEHAREALGDAVGAPPAEPAASARRATVLQAELTELELDEPVDAVFSNAVFHWVADHDRLFARLFAALRPGGRLVAQCGGEGNVERFHQAAREVGARAPYAEYLQGWVGPWNFAGPRETAERLGRAGFEGIETWLEPYPVVPEDPTGYLRTVCLGYHLERLPEELRDGFVEAVRNRSCEELDYVRLNLIAHSP